MVGITPDPSVEFLQQTFCQSSHLNLQEKLTCDLGFSCCNHPREVYGCVNMKMRPEGTKTIPLSKTNNKLRAPKGPSVAERNICCLGGCSWLTDNPELVFATKKEAEEEIERD